MKKASSILLFSVLFFSQSAFAQMAAPTRAELSEVRETNVSMSNYQAVQAVRQMEYFIKSLQRFDINANTSLDVILDNGQSVELNNNVLLKINRPNELYAKITTANKVREIFFNGKKFTFYDPKKTRFFTTLDMPANLNAMVNTLQQDYQVRLPLLDIIYGNDGQSLSSIETATYLGDALINGVLCRHFTFQQQNINWQIWIEKSENPLPRKLTITDTQATSMPRYTAFMNWNISPKRNNRTFTFVAPRGAQEVVVREIIIEE